MNTKVWIEMWIELFTILVVFQVDDHTKVHNIWWYDAFSSIYTSELTSKYKAKVSNFSFCKNIAANVVYKYLHKHS